MKKRRRFSIVVPVYNVELYLETCINSILSQTFEDYELLLIDDGSTDKSSIICDNFAEKDNRIEVIHQSNAGLSVARNRGIDRSIGDYLIFLDSDDYWAKKDVLEKINERLLISNADVLSFNYVKFSGTVFETPYFENKEDMPLDVQNNETLKYQIDNDLWIACAWNKVIKRSLFSEQKLHFEKGITSEDIEWCVRLAIYAEKFDYINEVIVCYRQRMLSISKNVTVEKVETLINNIEKCFALLNNEKKMDILKPYISYQYGTALYLISSLREKNDCKRLMNKVVKYKYVLKWSNNKKIRLIRSADSLGGLKFAIFLLRQRDRFNKMK